MIFLADGKVVGDLREPTADAVLERMKHLSSAASGATGIGS